jgi:hypothetical protein
MTLMQKRLCKGVAPFELCWQGYGFNTHKYQGGNSGKTENKMEDLAILLKTDDTESEAPDTGTISVPLQRRTAFTKNLDQIRSINFIK